MSETGARGRKLVERAPRVEASLWRRLRFEAQARCREALFNLHLPFAKRIANGQQRRRPHLGLDRGDFEQISFGALLEAIDRYDPLAGAHFEAFARARIRGAIADGAAKATEVGAQIGHRRRVELERVRSLGVAPGADPLSALSALATLLALGFIVEETQSNSASLSPFKSASRRDLEISVLQVIEKLPEAERCVIEQHYLNGVEFTHVARLLNLSKGRVSQLHHAALKRLREHLRRFE